MQPQHSQSATHVVSLMDGCRSGSLSVRMNGGGIRLPQVSAVSWRSFSQRRARKGLQNAGQLNGEQAECVLRLIAGHRPSNAVASYEHH
jgi:hypothetical protein